MRYGHIDRGDGPGWILGVLVIGAGVIHTGQLLAAGEYGTVLGYVGIAALLFVLIMVASVHMRGDSV
jgi:hypothetical protein